MSTASRSARRKENSKNLTDAYVKATLKMPFCDIPDELIEMKREQLLLYRATKQLKAEIKAREEQERRLTDSGKAGRKVIQHRPTLTKT